MLLRSADFWQLENGDVIDVRDNPRGKWNPAVYAKWSDRDHVVMLTSNHTFVSLPPECEVRVIMTYNPANDNFVKPVVMPGGLFYKLLRMSDDKPRFKYEGVKALLAYGGRPICSLNDTGVLWRAVVDKQEYGQYRLQAVAARVADMVRLHFWPNSKQLNFSPEVWAEVEAMLDPADVPTAEAIAALIAHPTPQQRQLSPSILRPSGPLRRHQQHMRPGPYDSRTQRRRHRNPSAPSSTSSAGLRNAVALPPLPAAGTTLAAPRAALVPAAAPACAEVHLPQAPHAAPSPFLPSAVARPIGAPESAAASLAAWLGSNSLANSTIASTLQVAGQPALAVAPAETAAAAALTAAAAAAPAVPAARQLALETLCHTLQRSQKVTLCCYSQLKSKRWVANGLQLDLLVDGIVGLGGNGEVYAVQATNHSVTSQVYADAAAAGQPSAAAAIAWRLQLDTSRAAAAAAAETGAPSSSNYQPAQQYALKVPRAYQHLPATVQQLQSDTDYYQTSYEVLQHEHQLLSQLMDCSGVVHSFAYGVIKYGPGGLLQLPCLLLERAEGSVQHLLDKAVTAAAAAPPPPAVGRHVGLPADDVWRLILNVRLDLDDLMEAGVVWKDLKPANILFARRGNSRLPVLCDFGGSVLVGTDGLEEHAAPGGTPAYMAPELKYGRRVGLACDVWALGCLLLTLRLGREVELLPDVEPADAAASWDAAAVLSKYQGELLPLELKFVADCLAYDPSTRPSIEALAEHDYLETIPASLRQTAAAGSAALGQMVAQFTAAALAAAEAAAETAAEAAAKNTAAKL